MAKQQWTTILILYLTKRIQGETQRNNQRNWRKTIANSKGYKIKTPYYEIEGFTVWGATAMMISELNAIVRSISF